MQGESFWGAMVFMALLMMSPAVWMFILAVIVARAIWNLSSGIGW